MWASEPADGLIRLAGHTWRAADGRPADFVWLQPAAGVVLTAVLDQTPRRRFLAFDDVPDVRAAVDREHQRFQKRGPLAGVLTSVHFLVLVEPDSIRRREIIAALVQDLGEPDRDRVLADVERISRHW